MSPANGNPQRPQNGGLMKRTCDQQRAQTKPSPGGRAFGFAKLADFGIEKTEADVEPLLKWFDERGHREIANGSRAGLRGRNLKTTSVTTSTIKASQPSINLPVPQNQVAARGAPMVNAP